MFLKLTLCELAWCPYADDGEGAYLHVEKDDKVLIAMDKISMIKPTQWDFAKDAAGSSKRDCADVYMDNGVTYQTAHSFQSLCEVLGAEVYTPPVSKAIESAPDITDEDIGIED